MKKITLVAAMLFAMGLFSQEENEVNLSEINNKKHELRIDALEGLAVPALDISYEYVLSKYSGFGASININLDRADNDFEQKFSVTPYYRQYFFNKEEYGARGFFAEGLFQFTSGEQEVFNFVNDSAVSSSESWNAFGVGFAIGQKWVSRNGFVFELLLGGGRNFGDDDFAPEGFFRGGLSVGYRF